MLGLLCLGLWSAVVLHRVWGNWADDLAAVYMAGHMIATGRPELVYVVSADSFVNTTPKVWQADLQALGAGKQPAFPYIYPPLWAVLVAPLTKIMGPLAFFNLAATILIPMLGFGVWLAWRLVRRAVAIPFWQWGLFSALLLQTGVIPAFALDLMQPQIAVAVLCLLAVERMAYGRDRAAGLALAVATALKLTPAALLLIFLIERRWRAIAAFALATAGFCGGNLLLVSPALNAAFLDTLSTIRGTMVLSGVNFSANSALYGLFYATGLIPPNDSAMTNALVHNPPALIGLISKTALLALLAASLAAARRIAAAWRPVFLLFQLTLLLGLFGPFSWAHYFLLQVLLAPAMLALPNPALRLSLAFATLCFGSVVALVKLQNLPLPGITAASVAVGTLLLLGLVVTRMAARTSPRPFPGE
ncbi:putative conserved integral membrane protein [Rhodovulum sp. P5]|nr:putative conserved integral membrane protein [Rhodovulum sp. P5]